MYLLATGTLYFNIYAVLNILFGLISHFFPDPLMNYYSPEAEVRWPLALLVVIFPVYVWVSRFLTKDIFANPEKIGLRVRKWLLYLTVFLAVILLIGDLVTLIYSFLQGDLTMPFILKVISVFAVGATVFWYYLYDLRRPAGEFSKTAKIFAWAASFAVLLVVVGGFFVAGSPFRQRLVRFDDQKISNLQDIQWRVVNYWQQKNKLPVTPEDLRDDISGYVPPLDPQSGASYEYRATGNLSFELCAQFNLTSNDSSAYPKTSVARPAPIGVPGAGNESWSHDVGRQCFSRTIDPELYKPVKPQS